MIGAATARLRLQKQRENYNKKVRRRSQSPGPKNQPNSLLTVNPTGLRRGSYHALLHSNDSPDDSVRSRPPKSLAQRKRSGSVPVIKFTLVSTLRLKWH